MGKKKVAVERKTRAEAARRSHGTDHFKNVKTHLTRARHISGAHCEEERKILRNITWNGNGW